MAARNFFQALEKLYSEWFEQMGDPDKGSKHWNGKPAEEQSSSKVRKTQEKKADGDLGYGFKKAQGHTRFPEDAS